MNQDTPPPSNPSDNQHGPDSGPTAEDTQSGSGSAPRSSGFDFDGFSKSVQDALNSGREDATKLFNEALPRAKEDLSKGVHDVAYALAFASTFAGAFIREIAPDALVDGLREGSAAGQRAANEAARHRRERQERSPEPPENEVGSVPV